MDYVKLGNSGLSVSRLALGCMSYGLKDRGNHAWTLSEEESRPFIKKALDVGINFFDTANVYSDGTSEEIVGRALADMANREEVVIATKVYGRMHPGPNGMGLSRKAIFAALDASLRRLGTDYVDLYQIHFWDNSTPIAETLEALHDAVKMGKVRYIGACNTYAWQFAQALSLATQHGWTRFVSMQNQLNLLYREEEREMLPLCRAENVAVLPFSPLARGRLTKGWDEVSERSKTDDVTRRFYAASADADRKVVDGLAALAAERGVPRAQIALAWLARRPGVTAPIIGATKPEHIEDALAALKIDLSPEESASLEQPYVPHTVVGLN